MTWVRTLGASLLLLAHARAFRWYMSRIPNSDRVPCPENSPLCFNTGICEAFGHHDCAPEGEINEFASVRTHVRRRLDGEDGEGLWTPAVCKSDSDGDGRTNGDELGDPCCEFNVGDSPFTTVDISHPDERSSVTARPSCFFSGPALNSVTVDGVDGSSIALTVDVRNTTCWCSITVTATPTSGTTVAHTITHRTSPVALRFCGLQPSTSYSISVSAANLGSQRSLFSTSQTTTASTAPALTQACFVSETLRVAGTVVPSGEPSVTLPALAAIVPVLLALLIATALVTRGACASLCGGLCMRNLLGAGAGARLCKRSSSKATGVVASPAPAKADDAEHKWRDLSGGAWIVLAVLAALSAWVLYAAYAYFEGLVYALNQGGDFGRATGYLAMVCIVITVALSARRLGVAWVTGIAIERSVRLHRTIGFATVALTVFHGVWMTIRSDSSGLLLDHIARYVPDWETNPAAGLIAGVFMLVVYLTSRRWVRRVSYGSFLTFHGVASVLVVIFTILHLPQSETKPLIYMLPAAFFILGDSAFFGFQLLTSSVEVLEVRTIRDSAAQRGPSDASIANGNPPSVLLSVRWFPGASDLFAPLGLGSGKPEPGQYMWFWVPGFSWGPKPFSVLTAHDEPTHPGAYRVQFGIKVTGKWTQALWNLAETVEGAVGAAGSTHGGGPLANPIATANHGPQGSCNAVGVPTPRFFLAGPLGRPAAPFEDPNALHGSVFIAGGIGITAVGGLFADQVQRCEAGENSAPRLIWSARSASLFHTIGARLPLTSPSDRVTARLYLSASRPTAPRAAPVSAASEGSSAAAVAVELGPVRASTSAPAATPESECLPSTVRSGRPDLRAELREAAILAAKAALGRQSGAEAAGRPAASASATTVEPIIGIAICAPQALTNSAVEACTALEGEPFRDAAVGNGGVDIVPRFYIHIETFDL